MLKSASVCNALQAAISAISESCVEANACLRTIVGAEYLGGLSMTVSNNVPHSRCAGIWHQ